MDQDHVALTIGVADGEVTERELQEFLDLRKLFDA